MLLAGACDDKYRAISGELAELIPDARAVVIDDAGHSAHIDNPAGVSAAILDFLREVDGGTAR